MALETERMRDDYFVPQLAQQPAHPGRMHPGSAQPRERSRTSDTACCAQSITAFRVLFPNQVIRADDLA